MTAKKTGTAEKADGVPIGNYREQPAEAIIETKGVKRCAILGSSRSVDDAPWNNKSIEIWAMASILGRPRYNRLFEMHDGTNKAVFDNMINAGCPVYMRTVSPKVPNSVAYPLEPILAAFGRHFSNTISYMVALAIMEEYKEIFLYGVNMEYGSEYGLQKPSLDYVIGFARGMGIAVYIPDDSDVARTHELYGYETSSLHKKMVKRQDLVQTELSILKQKERHAIEMRAKHEGGDEMLTYIVTYLAMGERKNDN